MNIFIWKYLKGNKIYGMIKIKKKLNFKTYTYRFNILLFADLTFIFEY